MKKVFAIIMTICLMVSVLAACSADPNEAKYLKAFELIEQGNYEEAYALFTQLGDYKDAAKEAAYFRYIPTSHYVEYSDEEENGTITYTVTLNDRNLIKTVVEEYNTGEKHTCNFTYNEFGHVIRRECSDADGATSLYEATYDEKGNLLNETITDEDGNVSKFDNTYNEKGQLLKVVTTNASDYYLSYTYTYDEEGREIKVVCEYEDGVEINETTYDAEGKILKTTWIVEGGEIYSESDYHYDENGKLLEILFTKEGEESGFTKMTYNDKDQLIKEYVLYTSNDDYTYTYEYDEHGNIIKTAYTASNIEDGKDVTTSTYKLVYLPFEYTEDEWTEICDSTKCWDWSHWE